MSHHAAHGSYRDLADRLNKFPQGAPPGKLQPGQSALKRGQSG